MHADVAKALYERITSLDDFDNSLQIEPEVPERIELIDRVYDALSDCTSAERGRLFHAPSPWHAFFKLWAHPAAEDLAIIIRC